MEGDRRDGCDSGSNGDEPRPRGSRSRGTTRSSQLNVLTLHHVLGAVMNCPGSGDGTRGLGLKHRSEVILSSGK